MLIAPAPVAGAEDAGRGSANALLVRAIDKAEQAEEAEPGRRVELLDAALRLLDRIREQHPDSEIAVKLATGQKIGAFDARQLEGRYDRAFAQVCLSDPQPECLDPLVRHVGRLQQQLDGRREALRQTRERVEALEDRLSGLSGIEQDLARVRDRLTAARERRAALESEARTLRRRNARLEAALEAAEQDNKAKEDRIADLSERLNSALADKISELARYRSEFFGRLREVLGDNENIRVVGERFVVQSEALFDSGSARLGPDGRQQIRALADTLRGIIDEIPDNVDWILRVDGHTDDRPIQTGRFPSNWELSTARATEVVKFLIDQGIPPDRLAATGFGEYQPIAEGSGDEALRKNRRIEFRLNAP